MVKGNPPRKLHPRRRRILEMRPQASTNNASGDAAAASGAIKKPKVDGQAAVDDNGLTFE